MKNDGWKRGLPPGKMTEENKQWFLDTYEVYFAPGGTKWHRVKKGKSVKDKPEEESFECVFCHKPVDPAKAKETEYGEFLCSPTCESEKAQCDAEAAYERFLDHYYGE